MLTEAGKICIVTCCDKRLSSDDISHDNGESSPNHMPVLRWSHQSESNISVRWEEECPSQSPVSPLSHSTYQEYISPCHHSQPHVTNSQSQDRTERLDQSAPRVMHPWLKCHVSVSFHKCICLTTIVKSEMVKQRAVLILLFSNLFHYFSVRDRDDE